MNVLFWCLSARERNYLSGGMSWVVWCVWNLISFNTLPYRIDTYHVINAIDEQQTTGHRIYRFLQVLRLLLSKDSHTQTYTHTDRTDRTDLQLLWGFAWSTKLAYSDESSHAFGHANRSEQVHMVLRMPSSPIPLCSSSSPSVVLPSNHRLRPSAASHSSIRHRLAYLTDHSS